MIHRYAMLGVLDERGFPTREMGSLETPARESDAPVVTGKRCLECGNLAIVRRDGCDFCSARGAVGACG